MGPQVLCSFLCCREKLAGVFSGDGLLPGPGLSSWPEVQEGKYLAAWFPGTTFPRDLWPTLGSPSRPVLTHTNQCGFPGWVGFSVLKC